MELPALLGGGTFTVVPAPGSAMYLVCPYLCCGAASSDDDENGYPSFACETFDFLSLVQLDGHPAWLGRIDITVPFIIDDGEIEMVCHAPPLAQWSACWLRRWSCNRGSSPRPLYPMAFVSYTASWARCVVCRELHHASI